MVFFSPDIILLLVIGVFVYWNIPSGLRKYILLVISGIFIFLIADAIEISLLLLYISIGYGLIKFCYGRNRNLFFYSAIICWIGLYCLIGGYIYGFLGLEIARFPIIIGVSYILFRVLQILFDLKEGIYSSFLSPANYILFCLNFLTLLSGPIQRVEDFNFQLSLIPRATFKEINLLSVFHRLILGLVKVLFLSSIIILLHQKILDSFLKVPQWDTLKFSLTAIIYLVFLYFNFSGYMDIIISISRLFGFELPENFNKPFLAKNFLDFWERWHISLSGWMRDYFFTPLLKTLVYWKSSYWWVLFFGIIVYFLNFLLLGLWHGTSIMFVYCGLMLAVGVSISKLLQTGMKVVSPYVKKYTIPNIGIVVQGALTGIVFAHISLAIIGFWITWDQLSVYWNMVSVFELVMMYFLTSVLGMGLYWAANFIERISSFNICSGRFFKEGCIAINMYFLIFSFFEFLNVTPEFVYQGF